MQTETTRQHLAGFEARKRGIASTGNPHPEGTAAHTSWAAGWNTADRDKHTTKLPIT